jgi:hypothetical protein
MSSVLEIKNDHSFEKLSRQFLICDFCFWAASAVAMRRHDIINCPQCNAEISRIPLADNERFTFSYDRKRGVELDFVSSRQ